MDHIHLARWADVALLCPATANSMNRLAAGLADDPIGALFLAWEIQKKPYLIAPAMNATMWDHPATRASRERLAGFGARLLPVGDGPSRLRRDRAKAACSRSRNSRSSSWAPWRRSDEAKVLVTSGATREPIDSVRFISNLSSGRTGALICDALVARGIEVTHVHGVDSGRPRASHGARPSPITPRSTRPCAGSLGTAPTRP